MKNTKNAVANSTLGGTSTETTAATPGKAARAAASAGKREYTPRGTTYWARRIVLKDGKPVGRGKPSKEGRGKRTVVYVPVGMEYDAAVHGPGVKYNTASHKATHKRIKKDSVSYTFDDGISPTKPKAAKAKVKAKAKGSPRRKASPSVPVVAVDASNAASAPAPVETPAVPASETPVATQA